MERKDDQQSIDSRQSPKFAVTKCYRWSCVAFSNYGIDGVKKDVGSGLVESRDEKK